MKAWIFIRTIIGYAIIGAAGLICGIPCLIIAALPAQWRYNSKVYYWFSNFFYKSVVFATFLPVKIEGKENLPKEPAIFVANHQSSLDIPLLGSLVNGNPHVWLFLKKYASVPIFGFITRRMNVVVDSSGLRKLVGSIYEALALIRQQARHVLIFPEGGRSQEIRSFFVGFAVIAKETGRPVIPVFMKNVGKAFPPGAFLLCPYPIKIIIGKPFLYESGEDQEHFIARVHEWFVHQNSVN